MRSERWAWHRSYHHVVELKDGGLVVVEVAVVVPGIDELLKKLGREEELEDLFI